MLTQREKNILHFLDGKGYCRAKQIGSVVGVSEKTIRNDILSINYKLDNIAFITSKPNSGYYLEIKDEKNFEKALNECEPDLPSTPEQRIDYIIKLFLTENRYIKTEEIANMLYQSTSTISTDLKEVRKTLQNYHLSLKTKPKYGMILKGEEKHLRELESDILHKKSESSDDQNHDIIAQILREVTESYNFQISEFAFNNLVIHLVVTIDRIKQGKTITFPSNYYNDLQNKLEYTIAKDIASRINKKLKIELPDSECAYISMHLLGKKLQNDQENTIIPQEYNMLVQKLLTELSQEYQINFTKDLNLQLALTLHLIPLSYRLKYDLRMENPLLESIKNNYPHAYIIAKSLANGLSKAFDKELSPDEIGYLALHINLSMEKEFINIRKKNIILVCATGKGTAKLLEYQYLQKFGNWINQLICCDVTGLKHQDFTDIDFIFTTVPIYDSVPVPVIETGFILDQNETIRIEQNIDDMSSVSTYFPKGLFFSDLDLHTQKEVITFLIQKASTLYTLPIDFEEMIWKREKIFSTAFDNYVALPHPYKPCTKETFASVAILQEPILWNDKSVKIVFLISLSKDNDANIQTFYGKLSKVLVNSSLLEQLIKNPTYDFLIQTLNQIKL